MPEFLSHVRIIPATDREKTTRMQTEDDRVALAMAAWYKDTCFGMLGLNLLTDEYGIAPGGNGWPDIVDPLGVYYVANSLLVSSGYRHYGVPRALYLAANEEVKRLGGRLIRQWDLKKAAERAGQPPVVAHERVAEKLWGDFVRGGLAEIRGRIPKSNIPFTVML